jgi:hypothetical protein
LLFPASSVSTRSFNVLSSLISSSICLSAIPMKNAILSQNNVTINKFSP